jgi:hypothetical protein
LKLKSITLKRFILIYSSLVFLKLIIYLKIKNKLIIKILLKELTQKLIYSILIFYYNTKI